MSSGGEGDVVMRYKHWIKKDREGEEEGRPKTRWQDYIAVDRRKKVLDTNITGDRCRWKRIIKNSEQVQRWVSKADQEIETYLVY